MESTSPRSVLLQKAQILQSCDLHNDVLQTFKELIKAYPKQQLSSSEVSMLVNAWKSVITPYRLAWVGLPQQPKPTDSENHKAALSKVKHSIVAAKIHSVCKETIELLDNVLLQNCTDPESRVQYLKLKGDSYRFICECAPADQLADATGQASQSYKEGFESGKKYLNTGNYNSLALSLSYAVFEHSIAHNTQKAISIAQETLNSTAPILDELDEEQYKHVASVLAVIRENLVDWIEKESLQSPTNKTVGC